jgi:hypothetical protein
VGHSHAPMSCLTLPDIYRLSAATFFKKLLEKNKKPQGLLYPTLPYGRLRYHLVCTFCSIVTLKRDGTAAHVERLNASVAKNSEATISK